MKKGYFGYLEKKRIYSLIKSILFLAVVLIIYFAALHHYHTNKNYFSIVAAVGALPTGRSIVETIMCFRAGSASQRVREAVGKIPGLGAYHTAYDLYLTSYERAYSLSHVAVGNGRLIGLTEVASTDCRLCEQHIAEMLGKDDIRGYRIRIYKDLREYTDALNELVNAAKTTQSGCKSNDPGESASSGQSESAASRDPSGSGAASESAESRKGSDRIDGSKDSSGAESVNGSKDSSGAESVDGSEDSSGAESIDGSERGESSNIRRADLRAEDEDRKAMVLLLSISL